jgi:hypothetical protein
MVCLIVGIAFHQFEFGASRNEVDSNRAGVLGLSKLKRRSKQHPGKSHTSLVNLVQIQFLGAKSTSIRDCVRRSVRWLVRPPRCDYVEN